MPSIYSWSHWCSFLCQVTAIHRFLYQNSKIMGAVFTFISIYNAFAFRYCCLESGCHVAAWPMATVPISNVQCANVDNNKNTHIFITIIIIIILYSSVQNANKLRSHAHILVRSGYACEYGLLPCKHCMSLSLSLTITHRFQNQNVRECNLIWKHFFPFCWSHCSAREK